MSDFFGKIGKKAEIVVLDDIVARLLKRCDQELDRHKEKSEMTVTEAKEIEEALFRKMLSEYDRKVSETSAEPVPDNWNDREQAAPKEKSAVRKRILYRGLEERKGKLYEMFIQANENNIKIVRDALRTAKRRSDDYYVELRSTLPMIADDLELLLEKRRISFTTRLLEIAGGMDNINKISPMLGIGDISLTMFNEGLLLNEQETRQKNAQLVEEAKEAERKSMDIKINSAIKMALKELEAVQEERHFADEDLPFLNKVEKEQLRQELMGKIRTKLSQMSICNCSV